ncbi:MAG: urease accessory protein UreD [Microcystis sp. LE19-10.1B]|uniref:urease accessory protein UreD n=1 Tax=Microcystis sp. LE19-10.1B TaxID=3016428 RepID=UPI0022C5C8E3|nr:urease accessory protein UreD [Microcystis sp. LE19-10.1B]MCZ8026095.1 urease accessory protein UreD [Microcystis sp. LE19-10.1B]MCZ8365768.1 urease accessory protein UreD [Microcystis sp. LE19-251.1A]
MWQGNLELIYKQKNLATQINHVYATAPLKVQRPFYPEGKNLCHTVILHTAGGIVGGDVLQQKIHLQAATNALITTASAGKVYQSNGQIAQQLIEIKIDDNAGLEWLPQETIIFNGAAFRQHLRVDLGENSSWLGWEITRFGRSARGEKFLAGEWHSNWEIWRSGQPLWLDRSCLLGGKMIEGFSGLNDSALIGTLVYIGQPVGRNLIEKVRDFSLEGERGVTNTLGDGLLCRYRGNSSGEVRQWFQQVWQILRREMSDREAIIPRVWLSW